MEQQVGGVGSKLDEYKSAFLNVVNSCKSKTDFEALFTVLSSLETFTL